MNAEDMFDEIIVYMSAWRRLRHAFIKEGETQPLDIKLELTA
jgi:hypothetical protein